MYPRILIAGLAAIVISATTLSARDQTGCTEAQVSVLLDIAGSHSEDRPVLTGSLGYYLADWVQCGIRVNYESVDNSSYWGYGAVYGLAGYVECNWKRWNCALTPFVSLSLAGLSEDNNDTVMVITAAPGVKLFLTETIGVSLQANFDFASEDIYDVEWDSAHRSRTAGDNFDISCTAGVRFLFF
jgi:hypothetical protein